MVREVREGKDEVGKLTMYRPAKRADLLSRGLFQRRALPAMVGRMKRQAMRQRWRWNLKLKALVRIEMLV
jgi:hypothetical protein